MSSYLFNHIALAVKDVEESIAFYQSLFKFTEIKNTASNSKTRWLSIGEGKELHLIPRPEAEIKLVKAVHFALATPDVEAFVEQLEKQNISYSDWRGVADKIYIRDDGIKQVYFQDPNGYWIEVNNAG